MLTLRSGSEASALLRLAQRATLRSGSEASALLRLSFAHATRSHYLLNY
ncbi:MAG: hypothetical protein F6K65_32205 [Moorea sp. SIO3C2]|nr:hypothetical protein [Moorena sp. SIO3C2]